TVRSHVKRALSKLRQRLAAERDADGRTTLALAPLLLGRRDVFAAGFRVLLATTKAKTAVGILVALVLVSVGLMRTWASPIGDAARPALLRGDRADRHPSAIAAGAAATAAVGPIARTAYAEAPIPWPAGGIRGRTVDGAGRPVAGAEVVLESQVSTQSIDPEPPATTLRTTSAPDGTFAFDVLLGAYDLVARRGHLRGARSRVSVDQRIDLTLTPHDVTNVVVLDPSGRPVADARVTSWRTSRERTDTATTDAAGTAKIATCRQSEVVLRAAKRGTKGSGGPLKDLPRRDDAVALALLPSVAVRCRTTDRVTGLPIAGAMLMHREAIGDETPTDDAGLCELTGLSAGSTFVIARRPGYVPEARLFDATPGAQLDVALAPARRLTVRVVDAASRPLRDAVVMLRHDVGNWVPVCSRVVTGSDGCACFDDFGRGGLLTAVKAGYGRAFATLGEDVDVASPLVVTLVPACRVAFRIAGFRGEALEACGGGDETAWSIGLRAADAPRDDPNVFERSIYSLDSDARVTAEDVPPGSYEATLRFGGAAYVESWRLDVAGDLSIVRTAPETALTLVAPPGVEVKDGAIVTLRSENGSASSTGYLKNGRAVVPVRRGVRYTSLRWRFGDQPVDLRFDQEAAELTLP
ncbi:MAG TPA: carboxypeptidase-like regulatory domain-containing protein, partial [Planctomycetota bacterium]|nr:carboxypeptidase-like regulatory domain-containing protein [Planctomycetota bacterium]